jgi:cytochrome c5
MSDNTEDHQHESPIKTPKQLIIVVVLSFVIPIALIGFLVAYVTGGKQGKDDAAVTKPAAVAARIAPVAAYTLKDMNAPKVYLTGEAVFKQYCASCHGAPGIAAAPKLGDMAAWAPRLKEGFDGLYADLVKGKGAMAARGGAPADDVSDYELKRAMVYLTNGSGGKFAEPAEPPKAAPVTAAAAPAAAAAAAPAVVIPPPVAAAAAPVADVGKAVYEKACMACHAAAVAGAPKFGDKAAWKDRIAQGNAKLYEHSIKGFQGKVGVMPAKGGNTTLTDDEVKASVNYMVSAAK